MWCGRRRRWAHFCIIALHLQGSHHTLGSWWCEEQTCTVQLVSYRGVYTSARWTKCLSTVCRKLYQRVMCYERQLNVLRLLGLVLGVFRLVLSGIWSPASSYTLNMITGNYVASARLHSSFRAPQPKRAESSDFNSLLWKAAIYATPKKTKINKLSKNLWMSPKKGPSQQARYKVP